MNWGEMFLFDVDSRKTGNTKKLLIVMLIIDTEQLSKRNKTYIRFNCIKITLTKTAYSTAHIYPQ